MYIELVFVRVLLDARDRGNTVCPESAAAEHDRVNHHTRARTASIHILLKIKW